MSIGVFSRHTVRLVIVIASVAWHLTSFLVLIASIRSHLASFVMGITSVVHDGTRQRRSITTVRMLVRSLAR